MKDKTQITSLRLKSNSIRILSADAIERAKSGHPGLPLGFSDVFTVLASDFLRYNPEDPTWHGRDRLVLSAGHGSMLLYSFLHFAGYEGYDIGEIKNFRQIDSLTPGHPEYNLSKGIETTTGPLGQGFANAVGMAIAQKKYENIMGDLMQYKIYCICGDGCLMEGITSEAASLAGHLGLNNLIVLFDDNQISIDGQTLLSTSDDHIQKFYSMGWEAFRVDGHNFDEIKEAISKAQALDKPCIIAFRTKIGYGSSKEGSEVSHGAPLGPDSVELLRKNLQWEYPPFEFSEEIYFEWRENTLKRNKKLYEEWVQKYEKLEEKQKIYLEAPDRSLIRESLAIYSNKEEDSIATRNLSGKIIEIIQKFSNKVIVGSADLSHSNSVYNKYSKPITKYDFSGNFIHYGIRENAMAAIMNGLATQNFLAIGGTFLVFSDYMRPSIRLSALMELPVIYIMTHDSIGVGEDGPTHQPIEHIASLRTMPNLNLFRPCDMSEVQVSFDIALSSKNPSMMILTRQKIPSFSSNAIRRDHIRRGAYFLEKEDNSDISIWASGSEVQIAMSVKKILQEVGVAVSVISSPNIGLFFTQEKEYIDLLIDYSSKFNCVIEAATKMGWEGVIGRNGLFFGMDSFGKSGSSDELYRYFGMTPHLIVEKILKLYKY